MHRKIAEICAGIKWLILGFFIRKRLLKTCLCLSVLLGGVLFVDAQLRRGPNCKIFRVGNVVVGDCSMQGLALGIPQDLDSNLNVLNLSNNNIQKITNRSFLRYRETLTTLDMSGLGKHGSKIVFDRGSFSQLYKLEYLDITKSCWNRAFILPSNLRILRIENCSTLMNVAHLRSLEEFHAAGNNWTEPPTFHELAPLRFVDLRRNAINKFDVEKIAPYCEIKVFRMDPFPKKTLPENFHSVSTYCACKAVDAWFKHTEMEHEMLDCTPPKGIVPTCDVTPSDRAMELRQECLDRVRAEQAIESKTNWRLVAILILLLLCILLPIATFIITGLKSRSKKKSADKKKRRRRTRDEGVQYEGGEEEEEWQETEDDGYYHCC